MTNPRITTHDVKNVGGGGTITHEWSVDRSDATVGNIVTTAHTTLADIAKKNPSQKFYVKDIDVFNVMTGEGMMLVVVLIFTISSE